MNILLPYSWLKDYCKTNLSPERLAEELSLHSFSVEKIKKEKGDFIFDIEITPNRGDALSVLGIAREVQAILNIPLKEKKIKERNGKEIALDVEIKKKELVPYFSAIVLDNVKIKESPKIIQERLLKVGIRPINNIVDITNYLMIDRGQPMHSFDYDKIMGKKMIIEESREGEKIKTLDGIERILPKGVIIIKDKEKRIIDLCGIMGAENSEITKETKKILLFVQAYDPVKIRRASMLLGHRTDAALRFEKGIDYEGILPSLWIAVEMAEKMAGAKVSSKLIKIVNREKKEVLIPLDYEKISSISGVEIKKKDTDRILKRLGFRVSKGMVHPHSSRADIETIEDIAEEVIRIYGYHKIPATLPVRAIPQREDDIVFKTEDKVRDFLKYRGFYECYNYTLTKKAEGDALEVINPLSSDFKFLRNSLLPQLIENLEKNEWTEEGMVFEISNVFIPKKDNLPSQPLFLAMVAKLDYLDFKGIIQSLLEEIRVPEEKVNFQILKIGDLYGVELNLEELIGKITRNKKYSPISKFSPIKEDLTFVVSKDDSYTEIRNLIIQSDKRIDSVVFKLIYKNYLTFSISYLDKEKQISSSESQKIREKIFRNLSKKMGIELKI